MANVVKSILLDEEMEVVGHEAVGEESDSVSVILYW